MWRTSIVLHTLCTQRHGFFTIFCLLCSKRITSLAEDLVRHVESIWRDYHIKYSNITCIVTDTEATMVKAARIFALHAQQAASEISWHSCIGRLLNLVTNLVFTDFPGSEGAMLAARDLVGHFSSSSQAEAVLLSKQIPGSAVKFIQDVATCWWSMCKRMLQLQPYLAIMEAEGLLKKNLKSLSGRLSRMPLHF
jgi:hypothetical protein